MHQFSAVKYLTPTSFVKKDGVSLPTKWNFTAKPAVTTGTGNGRAVPDLSADADPYTGYEEYFTGFQGSPLEIGWGGTSFVAPQLAGTTAVIDSAVGHRVGFWNPSIYRFAAQSSSPFTRWTRPARATTTCITPAPRAACSTPAPAWARPTSPSWPPTSADLRLIPG